MSTMRSGREIRHIVENARNFTNGSKYDMGLDDGSEDLYGMGKPTNYATMQPEVTDLRKQVHVLKAELDDMKQKYNALKRNFESVSFHSANDSLQNVHLNKMREEFENQIKSL